MADRRPLGSVEQPIILSEGKLYIHGLPFLVSVPSNVRVTPFSELCDSKVADCTGCFLGFETDAPRSRHVASLGKMKDMRFCSLFRFKPWWSTHWVGNGGSAMETETQFLLLDTPSKAASMRLAPHPYVLLLPILEGPFRASLQPGEDDNVDVCVESCDQGVECSNFRSVVYVHAGSDPYDLVQDALRALQAHLKTFRRLDEKKLPGVVKKFGWCTWGAAFLDVTPLCVWEGVKRLANGGCPPGFVLIDDGWQSIASDADPSEDALALTVPGEQMRCRLTSFKENKKFAEYVGGSLRDKPQESKETGPVSEEEEEEKGMRVFIRDLKTEFSGHLDHVYAWHAFCGYWGGVCPGDTHLRSRLLFPSLSPGLETTMKDLAVDEIARHGVGLVPPERAADLYDAMHSHLSRAGIDGVKVDVIPILELLSEGLGGRVELAKPYFNGLNKSIRKYFKGKGVIVSMEQCNDFLYLGTEQIALGCVGDDSWCSPDPYDPNGLYINEVYWLQGCHMVHCAYNSLWMGQVMQPVWGMFQTKHPCAAFHAASRAISGGPIYIGDKVGYHDFSLLEKLVVPDGSILRCRHYAQPTRDCLFQDPLHNGQTMLKIWNLNKYSGVVGAFNCQGGGWDKSERTIKCAAQFSNQVSCTVSPNDVEWCQVSVSPDSIVDVGRFAVYQSQAEMFSTIGPRGKIQVKLDTFNFEIFTFAPVRKMQNGIEFAPLGLENMLNTGGAVKDVRYGKAVVRVEVKGCGHFLSYASRDPKECILNNMLVDFEYSSTDGRLTIEVPWRGPSISVIEVCFQQNYGH